MVTFNTLGDMLLRRYVVDFVSQMQNLQSPIHGAMSMWNIEEDTEFGTLLHKEGLWSLYKYKKEKSILYHLCRNEYDRMRLYNNAVDARSGRCSYCDSQAPDEIRGLWKLHNWEWVQQHGGVE